MDLEIRDLTASLWPDYVKLFGKNGACGGCWCMSWRVPKGEKWADLKGEKARRRMKGLIEGGEAHGVIAYADGEPVGWCAYGRRPDFARLDRAPSLACDDAGKVWSLPCFFVKSGFRGQGVATALLAGALKMMKQHGARLAEGYPAKPPKSGEPLPAAFAWTGTRSLFAAAGFEVVGNRDGGKQRVRRAL
ncbi:MAG: GNAT family N-acetyltransferase [Myxococcaceae bacterium]